MPLNLVGKQHVSIKWKNRVNNFRKLQLQPNQHRKSQPCVRNKGPIQQTNYLLQIIFLFIKVLISHDKCNKILDAVLKMV